MLPYCTKNKILAAVDYHTCDIQPTRRQYGDIFGPEATVCLIIALFLADTDGERANLLHVGCEVWAGKFHENRDGPHNAGRREIPRESRIENQHLMMTDRQDRQGRRYREMMEMPQHEG